VSNTCCPLRVVLLRFAQTQAGNECGHKAVATLARNTVSFKERRDGVTVVGVDDTLNLLIVPGDDFRRKHDDPRA